MADNKKYFYIISDFDLTFEEANPGDFAKFEKYISNFENELGCEVKICFNSGTSRKDYEDRLKEFKQKCPEIEKRIDLAVLGNNWIVRKSGKCETIEREPLADKGCALEALVKDIGRLNMCGLVYMGDCYLDIPAMDYVKEASRSFDFPAYSVSPKSFDEGRMRKRAGFYSGKPRLLGCMEGLDKVKEWILGTQRG